MLGQPFVIENTRVWFGAERIHTQLHTLTLAFNACDTRLALKFPPVCTVAIASVIFS